MRLHIGPDVRLSPTHAGAREGATQEDSGGLIMPYRIMNPNGEWRKRANGRKVAEWGTRGEAERHLTPWDAKRGARVEEVPANQPSKGGEQT